MQLEIMSDGTLHITATVDVANTNRILLSQAGTHLGDLYYRDDERKKGKWKRTVLGSTSGYGTTVMYQCSECEQMSISKYRYCPNCGARMEESEE